MIRKLLSALLAMLLCVCLALAEEPAGIGSFTTMDLQGNVVTEAIFAQKDLTILNVWGTYCGPCIREMPELAAWAKELPENVQIITLVIDVNTADPANRGTRAALAILDQSGAEFTTLVMSRDLFPFVDLLIGVPTTFFIDSQGRFVHEEVLGAYVEQYKAITAELLAQ